MVLELHKQFQITVKRFRSYSILKMKRSDWLGDSGSFCQEFGQTRVFSDIWCAIHPNHNVQHFSLFLAESNDSILRKCWKSQFLGHIWPSAQIWANAIFSKKLGAVTFLVFWTINSIQNIRKTNEPIQRKKSLNGCTYVRTYLRSWIYRTLPPAWGPKWTNLPLMI